MGHPLHHAVDFEVGRRPIDAVDAVRLTDAGALDLVATADDTEITIWEMWADLEVT